MRPAGGFFHSINLIKAKALGSVLRIDELALFHPQKTESLIPTCQKAFCDKLELVRTVYS